MEEMHDHGCMLRACRRSIVNQVIEIKEFSAYISVLMQRFALNPIDIAVEHCERAHSTSKYSLFKLIRITFDLITGASAAPLRIFTFLGMGSACLGVLLVLYAGIRHFLSGPEMEGWFAVFAILFFFLSIMAFGIGLIGEYIGRMYFSVCQYPRFVIRSIIEEQSSEEKKEKK
jgi:undecaprenyl-phosphate 4-deoxy-4-formamido-L-arabinose transferase